jgi:membrane protease YdiL (CAAX protease family)
MSVVVFWLIARLGLLKEGGFTKVSEWKAIWLVWPLIIYSVLNGSDLIDSPYRINWSDGGLIALLVLLYISVGTIEEFLFRGLILPLMLRKWGSTRKGIYIAVLVSSSIFGVAHLLNFIAGRRDLLTTSTQICMVRSSGCSSRRCCCAIGPSGPRCSVTFCLTCAAT